MRNARRTVKMDVEVAVRGCHAEPEDEGPYPDRPDRVRKDDDQPNRRPRHLCQHACIRRAPIPGSGR